MVCKKEISKYLREQYRLKGDVIILCGTVDNYMALLKTNIKEALRNHSYNMFVRNKKLFLTVDFDSADSVHEIISAMNPFNFDHYFHDLAGKKWLAKYNTRHCLYALESDPFTTFVSHLYTKAGDGYFLFRRSHMSLKNLKKLVDE